MKIPLIVILLLCCMFISPSQTSIPVKGMDTSVRYASAKYFEWRRKVIEDTASAMHKRWCNQLDKLNEEVDSLIAAKRYRAWQVRRQNKEE